MARQPIKATPVVVAYLRRAVLLARAAGDRHVRSAHLVSAMEQMQLLRVGLPARLEAQGLGSPTGKNLRQRLDGDLWRYNIDRHELLALLDLAERADVAEIVMGHAMRALAATAPGAAEALARRFGVPLPTSANPSPGNATE